MRMESIERLQSLSNEQLIKAISLYLTIKETSGAISLTLPFALANGGVAPTSFVLIKKDLYGNDNLGTALFQARLKLSTRVPEDSVTEAVKLYDDWIEEVLTNIPEEEVFVSMDGNPLDGVSDSVISLIEHASNEEMYQALINCCRVDDRRASYVLEVIAVPLDEGVPRLRMNILTDTTGSQSVGKRLLQHMKHSELLLMQVIEKYVIEEQVNFEEHITDYDNIVHELMEKGFAGLAEFMEEVAAHLSYFETVKKLATEEPKQYKTVTRIHPDEHPELRDAGMDTLSPAIRSIFDFEQREDGYLISIPYTTTIGSSSLKLFVYEDDTQKDLFGRNFLNEFNTLEEQIWPAIDSVVEQDDQDLRNFISREVTHILQTYLNTLKMLIR